MLREMILDVNLSTNLNYQKSDEDNFDSNRLQADLHVPKYQAKRA
jgi:hypothetical protein